MNKVMLVGRMVADPVVRYTQGEKSYAVASYRLAVERKQKTNDGQSADFINCKAFGKTAEFIQKYFKKGRRIGITGRINTGSYTNKDNQKVYFVEVIADEVEFVDNVPQYNERPADDFTNIPDEIEEELPWS